MEYIKLDDLCSIITDGTHQTPTYTKEGYTFLSSKNVTNKKIDWNNVKYISKELHQELSKRISPQKNDILLAKNGTTGVAALVDRDDIFDIYVSLALLRPKSSIYPQYLLHVINSPITKRQFDKNLKGIGVKNLHLKEIKNVLVPVPEYEIQKKIVKILDKAQILIDKRKEQIKYLDELVKSKFIEMFGNPFDTTKWTIKKLKEISTSISDGSNIDKKYYQKHGEVLFLRIQNVWCNEFRLEDSVYISENVNQDYIDTSLRKGDLLITKIGRFYTKDSSLGRVSLYLGENDKANYSNNIMRVRLKDEVLSEYINSLLNLDDYNQYIRRVSVGGTDKRALSKTLIGDFPIIVPPMELQKKFIDFVNQVDKLKFEMEKSLEELENNFNSLLQKSFLGELFK